MLQEEAILIAEQHLRAAGDEVRGDAVARRGRFDSSIWYVRFRRENPPHVVVMVDEKTGLAFDHASDLTAHRLGVA